jgi:hypothetical protein
MNTKNESIYATTVYCNYDDDYDYDDDDDDDD